MLLVFILINVAGCFNVSFTSDVDININISDTRNLTYVFYSNTAVTVLYQGLFIDSYSSDCFMPKNLSSLALAGQWTFITEKCNETTSGYISFENYEIPYVEDSSGINYLIVIPLLTLMAAMLVIALCCVFTAFKRRQHYTPLQDKFREEFENVK